AERAPQRRAEGAQDEGRLGRVALGLLERERGVERRVERALGHDPVDRQAQLIADRLGRDRGLAVAGRAQAQVARQLPGGPDRLLAAADGYVAHAGASRRWPVVRGSAATAPARPTRTTSTPSGYSSPRAASRPSRSAT